MSNNFIFIMTNESQDNLYVIIVANDKIKVIKYTDIEDYVLSRNILYNEHRKRAYNKYLKLYYDYNDANDVNIELEMYLARNSVVGKNLNITCGRYNPHALSNKTDIAINLLNIVNKYSNNYVDCNIYYWNKQTINTVNNILSRDLRISSNYRIALAKLRQNGVYMQKHISIDKLRKNKNKSIKALYNLYNQLYNNIVLSKTFINAYDKIHNVLNNASSDGYDILSKLQLVKLLYFYNQLTYDKNKEETFF